MKVKANKNGSVKEFSDNDAVGYDRWRNIGKYDTRTKKAYYFDGSWYKEIGTKKEPKTFNTEEDALKAIMPLFLAAKKSKTEGV